jgi:hypothetical protein
MKDLMNKCAIRIMVLIGINKSRHLQMKNRKSKKWYKKIFLNYKFTQHSKEIEVLKIKYEDLLEKFLGLGIFF